MTSTTQVRPDLLTNPEILTIPARDGIRLAAALYRPAGPGPFPVLFAASPYRFDNNTLPASAQFLYRETGPIAFYVERGYAYVHLDIRGCGRSEGEFDFLGPKDQADLYDAIEFVGTQSWSSGKVGGLGQSYYCMLQWWMGIMNPPSLKCLGAYDGFIDLYRAGCYHGGIECDFFSYWWQQNRIINQHPANGVEPRWQDLDLDALIQQHPLYDDFWKERNAIERIEEIEVPVYSSGAWCKHQIHTRGNIDAYLRVSGPKKLRMSGVANAFAAVEEFDSVDFHREVLLPFYDHYLKGLDTDYVRRPPIEYELRGHHEMRSAESWPPPEVRYRSFQLSGAKSGSVVSLNDGSLTDKAPAQYDTVEYRYPNPGWVAGVVGFGPKGPASGFDPARCVLTFTTDALSEDLCIAGPVKLVVHLSSTRAETDVFVKLQDQFPAAAPADADGANPRADNVTRGWLKATRRALDAKRSTEMAPLPAHEKEEPLEPGKVYRLEISLEPTAYLFKAGHRIRIEIANGDSALTETVWPHLYRPDKIGADTYHFGPGVDSELVLPVLPNAGTASANRELKS